MKNVVVIFQATEQETESLALAFGLGAVQAGADIRLRHLNPSMATTLAHAGYGTLRVEDLRWAEGVAVFLESEDPTRLQSSGLHWAASLSTPKITARSSSSSILISVPSPFGCLNRLRVRSDSNDFETWTEPPPPST